jgi:hypothetical protein
MLNNGIEEIATFDRHFDAIPGITRRMLVGADLPLTTDA